MIRMSIFLALFTVIMSNVALGDKFKVEVAEIKCTAKDEYEKALCEKMEEQRKHYQETWSKYGYQCMDDNPCPED